MCPELFQPSQNTASAAPVSPSVPPRVFAHRGAMAYRPQNTLASFELAWNMGARAIELDVQCTHDGELVVFHDDTLDALTDGTGYIRDHAASEIFALDAGTHFAPEYADARIPTLTQILQARPVGTWVNIEIKTELLDATPEQLALRATQGTPELTRMPDSIVEQDAVRVGQRTAQALNELSKSIPDLLKHIIVSSFHPIALEAFAHACPSVALAYIHSHDVYYNTEPLMRSMTHVRLSALHLDKHEVSADTVTQAHQNGLKLRVWTVNDPALAQQLFDWGVDGIFTNVPEIMRSLGAM